MLAGLVGITAGCQVIALWGALLVGLICGITVSLLVPFIDARLKIDDPVGAISVHGGCGVMGTLLVGDVYKRQALNISSSPEFAKAH